MKRQSTAFKPEILQFIRCNYQKYQDIDIKTTEKTKKNSLQIHSNCVTDDKYDTAKTVKLCIPNPLFQELSSKRSKDDFGQKLSFTCLISTKMLYTLQ